MTKEMQVANFEERALLYAEKHGIFVYKISGSEMIYHEELLTGIYKATVNLNTMKETREQIKAFKY